MTKIIAFSGRIGSGKNTCANLVEKFYVEELFKLGFLRADELNKPPSEIFVEIDKFKCPLVKQYSYAYWLKFICMKVLGLTWEQCHTEEGKNELTHLRWENVPGVYSGGCDKEHLEWRIFYGEGEPDDFVCPFIFHEPGFMTGREVLQIWGTEVFRRAYNNVWVDSTIRKIKEERPILALITDTRFINEVEGVKSESGIVIRLTRNEDMESSHESETQLDNYDNFDYILNNKVLDLRQQEEAVKMMIKELGIV